MSIYNTLNTLSLQITPNALAVEVHYTTFITHLSLWGALWGILFSLFAIGFLGYNRNKFRKEHPDWEEFDKKVERMEKDMVAAGNEGYGGGEVELVDISVLRKNVVGKLE